jgi:hypothetical protein
MSPFFKGLVVLAIHLCLVATLGAKLLYDRATLPRLWVSAVPYDPDLPVRGRYVSLQLIVEPRGIDESKKGSDQTSHPVSLHVENGRLLAVAVKSIPRNPSDLSVRYAKIGHEKVAVLNEPVAFYIPEHIPDPSRRNQGEQLWVEATVPTKGIPRPIRLGVSKDGGPIVPLNIK